MSDNIQIIRNTSYIVLNLSSLIGLDDTQAYVDFHTSIDSFLSDQEQEDGASILTDFICQKTLSIDSMIETQFMSFYHAIDSAINLIIDALKALKALTDFKTSIAQNCVINCAALLEQIRFLNKVHFTA